jgi:hypothetical protein
MRTVEIPRRAWAERLNQFTAVHDGWLVSVDVLSPAMGAQRQIDKLPLLAISADRTDRDGAVALSVAQSGAGHLTHVIHEVTRIYVEQTDDEADVALEIESADGVKTIVRFWVAALPETVDGIIRR